MYYGRDFSTVGPDEVFDAWFDYARDFRPGDVDYIASAVFSLTKIETVDGATEDTSPADHLSGLAAIEASEVSGRDTIAVQRIDTLVAGNRYIVKCLATTSGGQVLEAYSKVWCRDAA